jgi:hypothetical protein
MDTAMNTGKLMQMAESCHQSGAVLAARLENEYPSDELKMVACRVARRAGIDYIGSNRLEDVALLQSHSRDRLKVKCALPSLVSVDEAAVLRNFGCSRFQVPDPAPLPAAFQFRQAGSASPESSIPIHSP